MNKKHFLALGLIFALLAACGPQNAPTSGPQAWVDAPLHGSSIPLAPYQIIAHGASPFGVSQFELMITGQGPEMIPAPADQAGQTLVYINYMWTPPAPGIYLIQVRAAGADGAYGQMAEAQVQVGEVLVAPPAEDACIWTAEVNVFVRSGPGASLYPEITAVEAGQMFPVVGKSQDGFFWAIQLENGPVGYVPMADRFGMVTGNCDVPTLPDPPAPAPTEFATQCSDGLDNDGDGRTDFVLGGAGVGDRECLSAEDNDESVR
ncbi:MAG: hypothetical protein ACREUU_12475 [Gammaproteobacteria bacterium]